MQTAILISPPETPITTAAELAAMIAVDATPEFRTILDTLIAAATAKIDGFHGELGRCIVDQTWRVWCGAWPNTGGIRLPYVGVTSIAAVRYIDEAGSAQMLPTNAYRLRQDACGTYVEILGDYPALGVGYDDTVKVDFVAGYGPDIENIPPDLVLAVMHLAAHWFENREGQGEVPPQVKSLLSRHWVPRV